MKIPINLASQPFRRARAMMMASVAVAVLLAATLGVLISLILSDRSQLADVRRDLVRINRQIRATTTEQARLDALLRRPENAEVLERNVFLNQLLYRKGISWTRIFADLEKTLPYNVRIMTIRPFVNGQDQVTLDMVVAAESPEPVIEMVKALQSSPLFDSVTVPSSAPPSQAEPLYRYRVNVNYAQKL
ncbi:MAG TPA: PilN domain-containing protein [Bryobacteraceae bacterium]|nr:PilN domain-containing protein [Bryobacteraceae bacterium]